MIKKELILLVFYVFSLGLATWGFFSWGSSPLDKAVSFILGIIVLVRIFQLLITFSEWSKK